MFSIDVHTSPGPDGYGSNFSEKLVGEEVTNVVLQFIRNGKLPRKINSTLIALIPKVPAHQFAGITREEQEEIIAMAEFIQGTLPMRYLGLPLSSKKMDQDEMQPITIQDNRQDYQGILIRTILCRKIADC